MSHYLRTTSYVVFALNVSCVVCAWRIFFVPDVPFAMNRICLHLTDCKYTAYTQKCFV